MALLPGDFKSPMYTISSPGHIIFFEVAMGVAPMNSGFADRRVSYFATRPICNLQTLAPACRQAGNRSATEP
jgi:hypothetical protein